MASPFRVFRRHQKVLMVSLVGLAMVAFVFGPALLDLFTGRGNKDPVALRTTKFGNITENQLSYMIGDRHRLMNFLETVVRQVRMMGGRPQGALAMTVLSQLQPVTEESTVNHWLLAQEAEQMGMVVTDEEVNQCLTELTDNCIKFTDLRSEYLNPNRGGISEQQLFSLLKAEIAASQMALWAQVGIARRRRRSAGSITARLNRRATAELAAVPVAPYAKKVAEPKTAELEAFFEDHKNQYASPDSPEPGFRVPHRIAVQYFRADTDKFADPKTITEAQIKEEYEKEKEMYDRFGALMPEKPKTEKAGKSEKAEKPEAASPKQGKPSAEEKKSAPETKKSAPEAKKPAPEAKKPAPEAKKPAPVEKETAKPQSKAAPAEVKKPATGEKSAAPPQKKPAAEEKGSGKTSSAVAWPFRLAAYSGDAKPATPKDAKATPPKDNKPAAAGKLPEAAAVKKPATPDAKAGQTPATPPELVPARPTRPGEPKKEEQEPAKEVPAKETAPSKPSPPKGVLTPRLKELIRDRLAERKATEKIDAVFAPLETLMNEWQRKKVRYGRKHQPDEKPPADLDFAALAKAKGLRGRQTPLISAIDASEYAIGKSLVEDRVPFTAYAYQAATLKPTRSTDEKGRHYLFWIVDETLEKVPKFSDPGVKEEATAAWKMVQARKDALAAAKKLAKEAVAAGKSLKKFFADRPDIRVVQPEPFTWMTYGNVASSASYAPPVISEVEGVNLPGQAFMREVFSLKKGETGAAMNQPQTVAYVIRLVDSAPPTSVLLAEFESSTPDTYAELARADTAQAYQAWLKELKRQAGLTWTPNRAKRPERGAGGPSAPEPVDESDD